MVYRGQALGEMHAVDKERIVDAIDLFFQSLSNRWRESVLLSDRLRAARTRQFGGSPKMLPITHALVRGLEGVRVVEARPTEPTFQDIVPDGHDSIPALRTRFAMSREGWDRLREVLLSESLVRRELLVVSQGRTKAQQRLSAKPIWSSVDDEYEDYVESFYAMPTVSEGLAKFLARKGCIARDFKQLRLNRDVAREFADFLLESVGQEWVSYEVVALLNTPPVDAIEPQVIWEGAVQNRPCTLAVGYPTDELITSVLRDEGWDTSLSSYSSAGQANLVLQFRYEMPRVVKDEEAEAAHSDACERVREAIDCLRLVRDEDIGILHFLARPRSAFAPSVPWIFPEHPHGSYDHPIRRKYEKPSFETLSSEEVERWVRLMKADWTKRNNVAGLAMAMSCLRESYERQPIASGKRLVELVTGLEAVYLSDAKEEVLFRIRLRCAKFLEDTLEGRIDVYIALNEIYSLRSGIVHGSELKEKDLSRLETVNGRALALLQKTVTKLLEGDYAIRAGSGAAEFWRDLVLR